MKVTHVHNFWVRMCIYIHVQNNIIFLVFKKLILQVRRFTFDLLSDRILVWFIVIFWINNNGVLSSEHAAIMPTYFVSLIQFGLPIFFGLLVIKGTRRKLEKNGVPNQPSFHTLDVQTTDLANVLVKILSPYRQTSVLVINQMNDRNVYESKIWPCVLRWGLLAFCLQISCVAWHFELKPL